MVQQSPEKRPSSIDEIKRILQANKNTFISRQKLDQLRNTVVPSSAVTDPFLDNPVAVIQADIRGNSLVATLNQQPPPNWIRIFVNQPLRLFVAGAEPANWRIFENKAALAFHPQRLEAESPLIFEHFKNYVQNANALYTEHLESEARRQQLDEERALRERIAEEERRQRILSKLRI